MARRPFDLIAFDGDDTLWHNERSYRDGREQFRRLLAGAGVDVSADEVEGGIRIEVVDDGAGFVVAESVHMPGHLGLLSMKERAQLAGGWFRVVSEPGAGAKVEFWVPRNL